MTRKREQNLRSDESPRDRKKKNAALWPFWARKKQEKTNKNQPTMPEKLTEKFIQTNPLRKRTPTKEVRGGNTQKKARLRERERERERGGKKKPYEAGEKMRVSKSFSAGRRLTRRRCLEVGATCTDGEGGRGTTPSSQIRPMKRMQTHKGTATSRLEGALDLHTFGGHLKYRQHQGIEKAISVAEPRLLK